MKPVPQTLYSIWVIYMKLQKSNCNDGEEISECPWSVVGWVCDYKRMTQGSILGTLEHSGILIIVMSTLI